MVVTPNVGKDANYSHIASRNVKWYSHSGELGHFFMKLNMRIPYNPTINCTIGYLFQRNGNLSLYKNLYRRVHSFILTANHWK